MKNTKKLILSGLFLALCILLPMLFGNVQQLGEMLAPMHIPVLICGFICGWPYGLAVGFLAPLLKFFLTGLPPLMPVGLGMMFELAAYGAISGLMYKLLPKKLLYAFVALIVAMIAGRAVYGVAMTFILMANGGAYTWAAFVSAAFVKAFPGIIAHIVLIPLLVAALKKANLMLNE